MSHKKNTLGDEDVFHGAVDQAQTGDLFLGKEALYAGRERSGSTVDDAAVAATSRTSPPGGHLRAARAYQLSYKKNALGCEGVFHGAVDQAQTGDLFLGKEALYQLSYYRATLHTLASSFQAVNSLKARADSPHQQAFAQRNPVHTYGIFFFMEKWYLHYIVSKHLSFSNEIIT